MWDWARKPEREARDFASAHGLTFHADEALALPESKISHPFQQDQRHDCVSGQWRGREVQRFSTSRITVELMTLNGTLPRLQIVPADFESGALPIGSWTVKTGDPVFDSRWTVLTDDAEFAGAFLSPRMREALLHPAASGRAIVVDGAAMYLWAPGEQTWSDTRVRFEFLSVMSGRIESAVWDRFQSLPQALAQSDTATVWVPGNDPEAEVNQWRVAELPIEQQDSEALGDTDEFEVALLSAELDGFTFIPGPDDEVKAYESWRVAPDLQS